MLSFVQNGPYSPNVDTVRTQHGAICWRLDRGAVQVLLISSRETGRWIIPKGWPINGLSPHETALREAWEEAGVTGAADPLCLGVYPYQKMLTSDQAIPCVVTVYGVKVDRLRVRFPERKERRRKWFLPQKAADKVEEPALRTLLAGFIPTASVGQTG